VGVRCAALVLVGATSAVGAADTPKVIPGATYTAEGTELVVDASGTRVHVLALPVHAACKGAAPESQGDDGAAGWASSPSTPTAGSRTSTWGAPRWPRGP
jgi:hypothetical protein